MNQLALMLAAYLALVGQPDNLKPVQQHEWDSFKLAHNKSYESDQIDTLRRLVFAVNKAKIEQQNAELKKAGASYEMGVNKFTDWTADEMRRLNGLRPRAEQRRVSAEDATYVQQLLSDDQSLPEEFDWRKVEGRVSEVKDQGFCGSCWTFAATGALEGQEKAKKLRGGKLVSLSEQNLVDCVYVNATPQRLGCDGGTPEDAFDYVQRFGIDDEKSYPYKFGDGECKFKPAKVVLSDRGFVDLDHDEEKLKEILYKVGPIAIGIASRDLSGYNTGVYKANCVQPDQTVDHAVLLVGYGKDSKNGDFWIVKNSWGGDWGESGYFRLARGSNSACVTFQPSIPKF